MATDTRGANLGLFLGPDVIIAAFVRPGCGVPRVVAVGTTPMPKDSMAGSSVRDPARVGQAVKTLLRSMHSRTTSAAVCVAPAASGMRTFRMPDAPERERRQLVRGELETTGALPLGAGAFGHLWVKAPPDNEHNEADVFAFYSDDIAVDSIREALRIAGLRCDCIEPYSITVVRGYLMSRDSHEPIALLCPSETHTDLCIHDGREVRYLRRISGGWDEMRYSAPASGPTHAPEEPQRHLFGGEDVVEADETGAPSPLFGPEGDPASVTRAFLTAEVARSFAFYSREYKDADVPRSLVVLAPNRYSEEIAQTLTPALPIPVVCDDASARLELQETADGVSGLLGFLAAAGAGMGDAAALLPRVDTSRQEAAAISRRQAPNVLLVGMAGSTVWMILAAIASVALMLAQSAAETRNNSLKQEIEKEWARRAGPLRNQKVFSAARQAQLKTAVPAPTVLAAVARAHTGPLSLSSIRIEAESKVVLEGDALTPESMQQFADNLAKTGAFGVPVFDMMHQDSDGRFSFKILGSSSQLSPEGAKGGQAVNPAPVSEGG